MKKLVTTFAMIALAFAAATPSMAASLVFDTFSYNNGDLVPNGGWANYSGATTDIQVASGHARIVPAAANDDHILFTPQATTVKTYACFDVTVEPFINQPKPVYFAELKDAGAANLVSRVYVLPLAAGGWTFGLSHSSTSATVGVVPWGTALSSGVQYHLVINYDPNNRSSTLWVNPTNELSPSVTDVNASFTEVALDHFGLRESSSASTLPPAQTTAFAGSANAIISVDNLGIGTTFADACAQYQSTPAQRSTWGQVKQIYR